MREVGLEPTESEDTGLQPVALPITLYSLETRSEGFEPPEFLRSLVFKTSAISQTLPKPHDLSAKLLLQLICAMCVPPIFRVIVTLLDLRNTVWYPLSCDIYTNRLFAIFFHFPRIPAHLRPEFSTSSELVQVLLYLRPIRCDPMGPNLFLQVVKLLSRLKVG